ncbi:MAG: 4Fe-4S binding protein [Deltaproteobacteria bacterium]|nr:4Fe-4S binding protein [Deltaproteobacteria bacterium]MBW2219752.1 4Fe-4S binding protein [Deltaproteobacteria bacterium]
MNKRVAEFPGVKWIKNAGNFIKIIPEKCSGCGNCIKVCLGQCLELKDGSAHVKSLDTCMECGACWYVCDEEAIIFSWPPGGTGFKTDWG